MIDVLYKYIDDVKKQNIQAGTELIQAVERFQRDLQRDDIYFDEYKALKAITFIQNLQHFTGKFNDKYFILQPWQVFIISNIFGWIRRDTGLRRFTSAYIEVARKNGKALSLDTKIPTPDGFTTMEYIKKGDVVFDDKGHKCDVTFVTEFQYNRECYEVTFEDGEKIIADAEHQWSVITKESKREFNKVKFNRVNSVHNKYIEYRDGGFHIKTTEQMFNNVLYNNKKTEYRYKVPMNKAVEFDYKDLLIDPYLLGLWLGDGDSNKPRITTHKDDIYMYDFIQNLGYRCRYLQTEKRNNNVYTVNLAEEKGKYNKNRSFTKELKYLNLLQNKHIPIDYLWSSKEQRLALLQGLMDTDGCISKKGQCEFSNTNEQLIKQVSQLLSSLGIKHNIKTRTTKCNNKVFFSYRIGFYTDKTLPCFRLERKYNRLKDKLDRDLWLKTIVDIKKINSVPVKCITVNSENSLYLAGDKFTVTHNTALSAAISLYCLIADGEANAEVILAANSREQASIAYTAVSKFAKKLDPKQKYLKPFRNQMLYSDSTIKVVASDSSKLDGLNASCCLLDEYHAAKTSAVYDVLMSSMVMREQPLFIIITTAGFDKKGPCFSFRTTAKEVLQNLKEDDSQFIAIYSQDDKQDWTNEKYWAMSNPNMNVTVRKQYLKNEVNKAKNNISLETAIKTKNFNMWCDTITTWIPDKYILNSSKKFSLSEFNLEENELYVGVDLSSNSDITAVAYMFLRDDKYHFKLNYYLPEDSLNSAADKEYYKIQSHKGNLILTPGNVVDYNYILNDILNVNKDYYICKLGYDSWNATQFAISATENYLPIEEYSQSIASFNRPTKEFERLLLQGSIVLDNNEITRWMLSNVYLRTDQNGNVKPDKSKKDKKIDGVIAMLMCLGIYLNTPRYNVTII